MLCHKGYRRPRYHVLVPAGRVLLRLEVERSELGYALPELEARLAVARGGAVLQEVHRLDLAAVRAAERSLLALRLWGRGYLCYV